MENLVKKDLIKRTACLCIAILSVYSASAYEAKIEGTNYTVNWNTGSNFLYNVLRKESEPVDTVIIQKKGYGLIPGGTGLREYKDGNFIFQISEGEKSLSFDIYDFVFQNGIRPGEDGIAFFVENGKIDLLYGREDNCCFVITYDFNLNKVYLAKKKYISDIAFKLIAETSNDQPFSDIMEKIHLYLMTNKIEVSAPVQFYQNTDYAVGLGGGAYKNLFTFDGKNSLVMEVKLNPKWATYINKYPDSSDEAFPFSCSTSFFIENMKITTKSCLVEGNTTYVSSNMQNFDNNPWVPSIDVSKEVIELDGGTYPIHGLIIGNGFYNSEKEHLFKANNRVKEIEIIYDEPLNITHRVILLDTCFTQYIPLLSINSHKIKIKILSVYPGDKYNDTCINCIYGLKRLSLKEYDKAVGSR